jgi:hypothetical protein
MGKMDLAYRVSNETKVPVARAIIDNAMKIHLARFQYEIRVIFA